MRCGEMVSTEFKNRPIVGPAVAPPTTNTAMESVVCRANRTTQDLLLSKQ